MDMVHGDKRKKVSRLNKDAGHRHEIDVFVDALLEKKELPVSFEDYASTTLATFMILESLNKNKKITIDCSQYLNYRR